MPVVDHVEQVCDGCTLGKQHRTPFPQSSNFRATAGLELVHADLCGQISPMTPGGCSYFLLVVDDCSRYMWVEFLKTKDQALSYFKKIKMRAEVDHGKTMKALRTDRGGEFMSNLFSVFCTESGIKHYTTTPYTPKQNGVVERRNQTVVEMARCLLKSMSVPAKFWGEAVATAVYILNRSPTKSLRNKTPFEAWHGGKPDVSHFKTFGCTAHVKIAGPGLTKLADRSKKMVLLGYETGTTGYRLFDPVTERLCISRDVLFEENRPWEWDKATEVRQVEPETFTVEFQTTIHHPTHSENEADSNADNAVSPPGSGSVAQNFDGDPQSPVQEPAHIPNTPSTEQGHRGTPLSQASQDAPLRFRTISDLLDSTEEVHNFEYSGVCLLAADEPMSVEQALEQDCWRRAMQEELDSIYQNSTWEFTDLPSDHKAIGLKWVFKVKKDPEGNLVKHKARLVVKGYAQIQGVDYDEVFAPVARLETVRLLLSLAAQGEWEVHHMDVKSAFLNGDLMEEVYVQQPPGFTSSSSAKKVLKLEKALYGLKQAPRAWNARLDQELVKLEFTRSLEEHAVYKRGAGASQLLVGVYVDDLIICGPSSDKIAEFKQQMMKSFKMSDLGLLSYYLGMEVKQTPGAITICQKAYAEKIVEICGMKGCNPVDTPMEQHIKLLPGKPEDVVNATKFRSLVGSLRYLVNTRPDIAFSVGMVSRFMECPNSDHWSAIKRIVRYIAGTTNLGCKYIKGGHSELIGYSDSDHAGDLEKRKSTTGVVFFLGGNVVTWTSQKQRVVSLSSCESEYIAAATAACQGVWLSRLLADLTCCDLKKFSLRIDSKSALELSKNPVYHERSKHIDTRYHYIRECIDDGVIEVSHVGTEDQLADVLTKPLGRIRFVEMRQRLGVIRL